MKKFLLKSSICLLTLMLCLSSAVYADSKKKKQPTKDAGTTITLVTSGTGNTKEEATRNALRSALEQTYGAFVSANSTVVNDELVKDEIVSISAGNIVGYEELSFQDTNPKQVTLKAVVSISNLVAYAQNKGMAAELAGSTFAMNMKMEELNKQNQTKALSNLLDEAFLMYKTLFDYEIKVNEPQDCKKAIQIPVTINIKANKNTISFYEMVHNTLSSLAVATRKDVNLYGYEGIGFDGFEQFDEYAIGYRLRGSRDDDAGKSVYNFGRNLKNIISCGVLNFEVIDNLGNVSSFTYGDGSSSSSVYVINGKSVIPTNKLSTKNLSNNFSSFEGRVRKIRKDVRDKHGRNGDYRGIYRLEEYHNHWLNKKKPIEGETLYTVSLFLHYSLDEISKISKIEVRPINK